MAQLDQQPTARPPTALERVELSRKPRSFLPQVEPIIEDVRVRGDEAVQEYTLKFDGASPTAVCTPIEVCGWAMGAMGAGGCLGLRAPSARVHLWVGGHPGCGGRLAAAVGVERG